jgi:hypothetical protein
VFAAGEPEQRKAGLGRDAVLVSLQERLVGAVELA